VATLDGAMIAEPLVHEPMQSETDGAYDLAALFGRDIYDVIGSAEGASPVCDPLQEVSTEDIRDMILRSNLETRMTVLGWNHEVRLHFLVF
jgi:hypothetical protein